MKKNKEKKQRKRRLFKNRSITTTMFLLSFVSITAVLLIGFLTIVVIVPRVYSTFVTTEIKNNITATIEYYDIDLDEVLNNPMVKVDHDADPFDTSEILPFISNIPDFEKNTSEADEEILTQTINLNYILGSLAMSRSAVIEIIDTDDNIVYQTPNWLQDNYRGIRFHDTPKFTQSQFFLKDFIEDNKWVTRTTTLSLDEEYTLNVRLDLRSFNQSIFLFRQMFSYMFIIGGLFALIVAIILSYVVTKPLKELKKIASSMENMDFSIRYDKNRSDEIGQLGKTLNHMMDRLGTTINRLQAELRKEKRTDKLRKEFVAQVSHELKTPVAIVANYTEALLDGVADTKEEQDSYLTTIENECHKMAHIINDLLDLSQMEAGTFKIHKSEFELKDLIDDLVGKYDNLVKGKYDFITDVKIDSALICGDELRIEQAVSNLLSNALKHTKEQGYIKLNASKENNMVHIQVENEGEPISDKLMLHIWDSFTKGADEKGAGLGLSITKNIVELHNGEYYVQNLDSSVLFGIRLPLKEKS